MYMYVSSFSASPLQYKMSQEPHTHVGKNALMMIDC